MMKVELRVNGVSRTADVEPRKTLLDTLRENFLLNGAHAGCEHGVCGACTVLVDGEPVRSCLMFAVQADGYEITTIEGLAPAPGELSVIQDAFCETGLQCGYAGMILSAHALPAPTLRAGKRSSRRSPAICRCTGWAVGSRQFAADRLQKSMRCGRVTGPDSQAPGMTPEEAFSKQLRPMRRRGSCDDRRSSAFASSPAIAVFAKTRFVAGRGAMSPTSRLKACCMSRCCHRASAAIVSSMPPPRF
jgi:carbon-monoxide dehydrogenase small subunit